MKQAQASVFMVIGVILLLVIMVGFLFFIAPKTAAPESSQSMDTFLQQCFKTAGECAIVEAGINRDNLNLDEIKDNAENSIKEKGIACIDVARELNDGTVEYSTLSPAVELTQQNVLLSIDHDITKKTRTSEQRMNSFQAQIPVRFKELYTVARMDFPLGREYIPANIAANNMNVSVWAGVELRS